MSVHHKSCFCKYSGWDEECFNVNIKKSLFGLGMRVCVKTNDRINSISTYCKFYEKPKRPVDPPLPSKRKD